MVQRSKFSHKDLSRMKNHSVDSPLRVIAHIDLDAFYAQCETVRLGIDEKEPLAVAQWANLIAINYPARAAGLTSRHADAEEAKKICPNLHVVHVATWKAGDTKWSYRENSAKEIATSKACLDPYRIESRKILAIFKSHCDRVEKASIDESFLDLSALVHSKLLAQYSQFLKGLPPYDDSTEELPLPPSSVIDWGDVNLIDLDDGKSEEEYPDWDDVCMAIASNIVADIRREIREVLKYTCSAGVACNKMLAKLASGQKKPNNQTVVRNRAIFQFLSKFKFTKIRNLGGKFGQQIADYYNTDSVAELLKIPLDSFVQRLRSEESAVWLFNTIRGIDKTEVNPRTLIKSMLSAKSFRPVINNTKEALRWVRIFVADICSRMQDEGIMTGARRPKTLTLHHKSSGVGKSRQATIPGGKELNEEVMMQLAMDLLKQVEAEGGFYPCSVLSLQVGGFEEREKGNRNIMGFLVKMEPSVKMEEKRKLLELTDDQEDVLSRKKTRIYTEAQNDEDTHIDEGESNDCPTNNSIFAQDNQESMLNEPVEISKHSASIDQSIQFTGETREESDSYICPTCKLCIAIPEQSEHTDWHFAMNIMKEERELERQRQELERGKEQKARSKNGALAKRGGRGGSNSGREKGQRTLEFFGALGKHDQ